MQEVPPLHDQIMVLQAELKFVRNRLNTVEVDRARIVKERDALRDALTSIASYVCRDIDNGYEDFLAVRDAAKAALRQGGE